MKKKMKYLLLGNSLILRYILPIILSEIFNREKILLEVKRILPTKLEQERQL